MVIFAEETLSVKLHLLCSALVFREYEIGALVRKRLKKLKVIKIINILCETLLFIQRVPISIASELFKMAYRGLKGFRVTHTELLCF